MIGPLRVGAQRHAFVTATVEIHMGASVTTYVLRSPKGDGFQRLAELLHQDGYCSDGPCWTEDLTLQVDRTDEAASC